MKRLENLIYKLSFLKKLNQFFFCDGSKSKVFFAIDLRDKIH